MRGPMTIDPQPILEWIWLMVRFGILGSLLLGMVGWSIAQGMTLLREAYATDGWTTDTRRMLAWNLIEPGFSIPIMACCLKFWGWSWFAPSQQNLVLALLTTLAPMMILLVLWPIWVGTWQQDPRCRTMILLSMLLGLLRINIGFIVILRGFMPIQMLGLNVMVFGIGICFGVLILISILFVSISTQILLTHEVSIPRVVAEPTKGFQHSNRVS